MSTAIFNLLSECPGNRNAINEVAWQDKGGCRDEARANCKKRDNTFNPLSSAA